ncbi:MAG: 50S ribosomal protein L9 [Acidimicrobiales bacterium]|nr:MAG: 50S ribosomal protein L9 [Acidimicrobiales bacterium]
MKVILRQDVDGLGRKGDICDVADGHFRNLLNPRGLAMKATKGAEVQAEAMRRAASIKNAASRADAEEVATMLVPSVITIAAKAGDGGRLFGSVGAGEIVEAVEAQTGAVVDRRTLNLEHPLKDLGQAMVMCKLHPEVEFPITVEVIEA